MTSPRPTRDQTLIPVRALSTDLAYWAGMVAVLLATMLFYTGIANWLYGRELTGLTPGKFMMPIIALGSTAAIASIISGLRAPLILLIVPVLYLVLMFTSSLVHQQDYQLTIARLAFMLTFPALMISAQATSRLAVRRALLCGLVFVCLANLLDYFFGSALPIPMSEIVGRAGGFHVNPNIAAQLISLSVPLAIASAPKKYRPLFYALTGAAVLVTLSRGGIILWGASVVLTEAFMVRKVALTARIIVALILAVLVMAALIVFGDAIIRGIVSILGPYLSPGTVSRLYFDMNDFAAEERRYAIRYAWELFQQYPIFGSGLGGGTRWTFGVFSHNMILQTLVEFGLVGLLWLFGFFALLRRIAGPAAVVLICLWLLASVFSHNLFDDTGVAVIIAFYGSQCWRKDGEGVALVRRRAPPRMRRVPMPVRGRAG